MWLLLKCGRIVDPSQGIDEVGNVLIVDGRIAGVGSVSEPNDGKYGSGQSYDVSGKVITPGLIDMHVHLREPGFEHKEDIESGSRAAAAGGFTTIVGMPNTNPAVDNRAIVEYILNRGRQVGLVNVHTTGAVTKGNKGEEMAELGDMVDAGAIAVSDDAFPIQNPDLMRRIMDYTRMLGVPILTHCEDKALAAEGVMNEGMCSTILGLRGIPAASEVVQVWRNILLAEMTCVPLHIQHVSTAGAIDAIRTAKAKGIKVTCETGPQYWTLTEEALGDYNTNFKMNPPVRTKADVEAIKNALADGTIDAIATDHAPHALEDKEVEMNYAAFGITGLETCVPLVISKLVDEGVLTLSQAVEKMTVVPAKILGLNAGTLKEGAPADVTIIDAEAEITVDFTSFKSKGKNTPFEGWKLKGSAVATIVGGKVVFDRDNMLPVAEDINGDNLYERAVRIVVSTGSASCSPIQRRLRIGYTKAVEMIDAMERQGIVGPIDESNQRKVLVSESELDGILAKHNGVAS